jgi:glucose-1-phosphate cytidylyltransferase
VSIIDTGRDSSVIERLRRVREYTLQETVLASYGDCLSDIDIGKMVEQHKKSGVTATFAVAHPTGRNAILSINEAGQYHGVKNAGTKDAWVNTCSMVLEPEAFDQLDIGIKNPAADTLIDCLANVEGIQTYCHEGFWSPVETRRDQTWLESLWAAGKAPWKVWED